ncbi:hypothetical protein [Ectothiorhodospira shaposhnikovii]|uniref:hypothetical protein n=1 Tax=Ectothiorhodospira shaposhnikovii TaxID=1054 RepID=UPI001EE9349D|nr:hypothetical protein [Ectothiorhodospira shaposhnikovii]MCG5512827.1 hypothetical protein [Ectothiorhodospira shaposhnikovii]
MGFFEKMLNLFKSPTVEIVEEEREIRLAEDIADLVCSVQTATKVANAARIVSRTVELEREAQMFWFLLNNLGRLAFKTKVVDGVTVVTEIVLKEKAEVFDADSIIDALGKVMKEVAK